MLAFAVAWVHEPEVIFPKYLAAAAAPPAERAERILDYSPLYLGVVRMVAAVAPPGDFQAVLVVQGVLHATTAAMVALAVSLLAGMGWGVAAGLGVAAYRPLLVYAGVHEPETVIAACLATAILGGVLARRRLVGTVARPGARGDMTLWASLALAFAPLALAGLGRPQHLLLLPVWAFWIATAAPGSSSVSPPAGTGSAEGAHTKERAGSRLSHYPAAGGDDLNGGPARPGDSRGPSRNHARRRARRMSWAAAGIAAVVLVGPVVVARSLTAGSPALMNPGPVFYEGNAPAAMGLVRFAPPAVIEIERAHREAYDYGHVAYRRIASAATGRSLSPGESNRWWAGLAAEGLTAWPGLSARRFGRKAALALAPYEAHDLAVAEGIDRRLRPLLPWGFALLLIALPWIPFASRDRLAALAGPLAVVALALALQTVVYASARQRLPMALGLWIAAPVLAADLVRTRLRLRPAIALPLGIATALAAGAAGGRIAVLDRLGWDRLLGPGPPSTGDLLLAYQEGRAQRPALREAAARFLAGVDFARAARPAESLQALSPLLGTDEDFTVDDKTVGVPEYWAARNLAALGRRQEALAMARSALGIRPQDPQVQALALALDTPIDQAAPVRSFRPPGTDPITARLLLARAALVAGDEQGTIELLQPLAERFPELVPAGPRKR